MNRDQVLAIFVLAGISVLKTWELPNGYWPKHPGYEALREASPWWLIRTPMGLIEIGWRKRVIHIDWSDTEFKAKIGQADVTKTDTMIHAWSELDAVANLKELFSKWQSSLASSPTTRQ